MWPTASCRKGSLCGFPLPASCGLQSRGGLGWSLPWCRPLPPNAALTLQAHNDLLRTYEAKLLAFGIPLDNVGFKPLETAVIGQTLGQGPAGLVSTPT